MCQYIEKMVSTALCLQMLSVCKCKWNQIRATMKLHRTIPCCEFLEPTSESQELLVERGHWVEWESEKEKKKELLIKHWCLACT